MALCIFAGRRVNGQFQIGAIIPDSTNWFNVHNVATENSPAHAASELKRMVEHDGHAFVVIAGDDFSHNLMSNWTETATNLHRLKDRLDLSNDFDACFTK
ncbi:MAG: hypothetical protein HKM24_04925 [Gammaproteobacteria bacterium]|nr:hypothetical protein [Gammaproteobacteria bacterium]